MVRLADQNLPHPPPDLPLEGGGKEGVSPVEGGGKGCSPSP